MNKDKVGMRYGMLTVLEDTGKRYHNSKVWLCQCDCGNTKEVPTVSLKDGHTKSCGCLIRNSESNGMYRHGGSNTRLYSVWNGMIDRCFKPSEPNYSKYGAKGITTCEEWKTFENFRDWALSNGYNENAERGNCTLDRIDNNGNYEPGNCRWTDMKVQSNNKSNNRNIAIDGVTRTLSEWGDIVGINPKTIWMRLSKGYSEKDAVFTPLKH